MRSWQRSRLGSVATRYAATTWTSRLTPSSVSLLCRTRELVHGRLDRGASPRVSPCGRAAVWWPTQRAVLGAHRLCRARVAGGELEDAWVKADGIALALEDDALEDVVLQDLTP